MQSQSQLPEEENNIIQPQFQPLPKLSTQETAAIWEDYPSIEHLEAGNIGPWLNERKHQLSIRAQDERTGMNLAKLICLAGGATGAVLYASNPLAVIGGMVAGAGYIWSVVQDLAITHQFAPIPFVRGSLTDFFASMGEAGAREEYLENQNELADLMLHLPPMERYELAMLYSHTHTLCFYLSQVGEGKRFYAYRWLLGWYIQLEGHFPQQGDLVSHLNDIKADPRVDYGAVTALQNYQKNLESKLPPPPTIPQLADSTVSLQGGTAAPQSLQAWLSGETPQQQEQSGVTTVDVTPNKEGEPAVLTTHHSDPLVNQIIQIILECLEVKRAPCNFIDVVETPKFRRVLLRKRPNTSAANVLGASEDLFCELGAVLPQLNVEPIVSMIKGGRLAVDIAKPESEWQKALFQSYIVPAYKSFESPVLLPIGIDMDGFLKEIDLSADATCGLLVGGITGGGKSMWATSSIASLVCQYSPDSLKLILSDTKRVEFRPFANLPHLMCPVAETVQSTVEALEQACSERERRERLFAEAGVRNLAQYNAKVSARERLPRIVIFIEETKTAVESRDSYLEGDEENPIKVFYSERFQFCKDEIKRLARAAGIFLIDSTQSPRQEVLPAGYRGQFSAFLAFRTGRPEESKICLANRYEDAVNLLGAGDGLYLDNQGLERVQSLFITPEEVDVIVARVVQIYGTREQYNLEEARKRLEGALGSPDTGEVPDRVPEFQGSSGAEVQSSGGSELPETPLETRDSYRDYQEIRKLRNAVPPTSKKDIVTKHWGYHNSLYKVGSQRYYDALTKHAAEWVLELHRQGKNAGTIASTIWCLRRNDGVDFDNVIDLIHDTINQAEALEDGSSNDAEQN